MKKFLLKRLLFIPFGVAAYIVTKYAQYNPCWAEQVYSRSVYPVLSTAVGYLPSLVGFSLSEWLVVLFLLFCLGYVVYYIRKVIISKDRRSITAYRGVAGAVAIFCIVYFVFTVLCGLNYHRYTFTYYTGYDVKQSCVEELEQLCMSLADDMGRVRMQLGEDADLYATKPGDFDYYAQHSVQTMQILAEQYPILDRSLYSAPKPVVMSELMSNAGIGGVFVPFTLESNINVKAPFFTIPSTMAHELAHQCGFMREDEANFIAYLACKQSDEPLMLYSGLFSAFDHSISALKEVDPGLASEIISGLPPAVQCDMAQHEQYWTQHEGIVSNISTAINDMYLKANSQTDGVDGYGRMVDLLLAEQRAGAGQPAGAQGAIR